MDTVTRTTSVFALAALLVLGFGAPRPTASDDDDGNASAGLTIAPPNHAVQAAFTRRSYRPRATATLRLRGRAPQLGLRVFHAGLGRHGPLEGAPVGPERTIRGTSQSVTVRLGNWPSGLYYAEVTTPGKGAWDAPFVLRPQHLGEHRVAVVLPTNTWQAYNFEDGDSWYADASVHTIDLTRPFVDGGVPPHYTGYDRGFIRWLVLHRHATDFFADDDLDTVATGAALARAYDLIVFSGHEEYVTEHEFDVVQRYRDLGGNLAFLAANNFFYKVVKHGDSMDGRWRWRDLGRPEASLVGSEYVDWNHARYANEPYVVQRATWLFRGTGLADGATFGKYGIEVDATSSASPRGTRVLAQINGIFGPGVNAQMTYYTTPRGAKVFAAGVMNFGGSALWPVVTTMLENLWSDLSRP
jgi:hypothetical protein